MASQQQRNGRSYSSEANSNQMARSNITVNPSAPSMRGNYEEGFEDSAVAQYSIRVEQQTGRGVNGGKAGRVNTKLVPYCDDPEGQGQQRRLRRSSAAGPGGFKSIEIGKPT